MQAECRPRFYKTELAVIYATSERAIFEAPIIAIGRIGSEHRHLLVANRPPLLDQRAGNGMISRLSITVASVPPFNMS